MSGRGKVLEPSHPVTDSRLKSTSVVCEVGAGGLQPADLPLEVLEVSRRVVGEGADLFLEVGQTRDGLRVPALSRRGFELVEKHVKA